MPREDRAQLPIEVCRIDGLDEDRREPEGAQFLLAFSVSSDRDDRDVREVGGRPPPREEPRAVLATERDVRQDGVGLHGPRPSSRRARLTPSR